MDFTARLILPIPLAQNEEHSTEPTEETNLPIPLVESQGGLC
jgi:hypothetical protein